MKIIHLSDLHLANEGKIIWDTDTVEHLHRALNTIKSISEIDLIVITGDISDDRSIWGYEYLDKNLSGLGIPIYCCPGNHDSMSIMREEYTPKNYRVEPKMKMKGWKFLFFNTVVPDDKDPSTNKARGMLKESDLEYLKRELEESVPTCIVFHHPPLEPGGWLNRKLLDNRDEFNEVIKRYDSVRLVLFGHIHYPIVCNMNGITYTSPSSIGFAFDKDLPKFQIADGQEGFNIITIDKEHIMVEQILI